MIILTITPSFFLLFIHKAEKGNIPSKQEFSEAKNKRQLLGHYPMLGQLLYARYFRNLHKLSTTKANATKTSATTNFGII